VFWRSGLILVRQALYHLSYTPSSIIEDLNNVVNELDLTDIHGTLHLTAPEYTFFLKCTWDTL
jgi:hypothetical protein